MRLLPSHIYRVPNVSASPSSRLPSQPCPLRSRRKTKPLALLVIQPHRQPSWQQTLAQTRRGVFWQPSHASPSPLRLSMQQKESPVRARQTCRSQSKLNNRPSPPGSSSEQGLRLRHGSARVSFACRHLLRLQPRVAFPGSSLHSFLGFFRLRDSLFGSPFLEFWPLLASSSPWLSRFEAKPALQAQPETPRQIFPPFRQLRMQLLRLRSRSIRNKPTCSYAKPLRLKPNKTTPQHRAH
ncbi:unannotated protein [freshwater metagenome]|uniref:Unannotated protein n=1 Tax=freshwater metagenome TaxID=449393 RepID=A0A6J6UQ15_9ZZZZ